MKNIAKKMISAVIVGVMLMLTTLPAFAATSFPSLSSSGYCEFTAAKQINVYKDTGLKTRGTSSPSKSYNAYTSKNDVCYIYKITSNYVQVNYPTSSGRKTGYIKRSDIIGVSAPSEKVTSQAKVTTYKAAKGVSYGYVEIGDTVYKLGTSSGYTQIIYTAKSGKRAYKLGWVTSSDYDKIKGGSPTPSKSLADVAATQIGYQGTNKNGTGHGDYTKYGEFTGTNGKAWCASFVSWCVNQAGVSTKLVPKTASCEYMRKNSSSFKNWNSSALKNINKNDVIFFSGSKGGESHHVGIVVSVSGSKITLIEGNTSSDIVKKNTYTVSNSSTGQIKNGKDNWAYFRGYIPVN